MNILLLTNLLEIGGIETNLVRLSQELNSRGHVVHVAARAGVLKDQVVSTGAIVHDLILKPTSPSSAIRDVLALRSLLRDSIDVIHVFSAKAAVLAWIALSLLPRRSRPAVIASPMGIITTPGEPSWITKARAQATVWNCDTAVLISPAIADLVASIPRRPRHAINAGVVGLPAFDLIDPVEIDKIRQELELQTTDSLVLTIGRLDRTKYHHLFVEAAALVVDRISNVQFRIVGEGPLANELLEQIQQGGLTNQVRLLGRRTDISRLLAVSDIYVRPGIDEGFIGITVLEAQAHQVPVVAFDTRDVRPAISNGISGLLIPTPDPSLLADAIKFLLDEPERANQLGRAGYLHSKHTFSIGSVVDNLETTYLETMTRLRDRS